MRSAAMPHSLRSSPIILICIVGTWALSTVRCSEAVKWPSPIKSFCDSNSRLSTVAGSVIKVIVVTHWRLGSPKLQIALLMTPITAHSPMPRKLCSHWESLALTQPEGTLNPALHQELSKHFSDAEILELGLVAAFWRGSPSSCSAYDRVEKKRTPPFSPAD
ncbi:MAG: hypothetical protein CM15mP103_04020 [Gammaproteobacteria bacterium]|nr:MAG: hypothetical protein CM15mP103_04020 [Gammaproteobacteria bacterium]